jgi:hypothetical protein
MGRPFAGVAFVDRHLPKRFISPSTMRASSSRLVAMACDVSLQPCGAFFPSLGLGQQRANVFRDRRRFREFSAKCRIKAKSFSDIRAHVGLTTSPFASSIECRAGHRRLGRSRDRQAKRFARGDRRVVRTVSAPVEGGLSIEIARRTILADDV